MIQRMSTLFDTQNLMPMGELSCSCQSVGGEPLYITGAQGAHLNDASNRQFIDYVGGAGLMIRHSRPGCRRYQSAAAKV